jgi:DNA polymerase-3 subunit gamma/tau
VLNVFGFTSEQTVSDLTGRILRGETPEGIDLLHEQCEAGKDMMRLMADLIGYLRDLLVFKAKPDAVNEDVDPDVQKSLAAHAELVSTDRLLDLIDQFAAAESRMKWAPNKKLHFEVAIIKAIQSLGQATLDEVIEKLGELRDGRARPAFAEATAGKPGMPPAKSTSERAPSAVASAKADDRGQTKLGAQRAGVIPTSRDYSEAHVEEKAATIDSEQIWQSILEKIPPKGSLRTLSGLVRPIGTDGRNFVLGHSPVDKTQVEVVASINNRRQLETLLKDVSGREWTVKFAAKDDIAPSSDADTPKSSESFKDEPLIQEAIELFNARVRS